MKKILICLAFVLFMPIVSAGSFSISSSATSVSVGSSVTIYVKASDAAGRFSVSSSNSGVMAFSDDASSVWLDNSSSSFKFTAKSAGSAVITVTPSDCAGYDEKEITGSKSITINVTNSSSGGGANNSSSNKKTVVSENNKTKSSINYLSSLGVEGFDLSPTFDKEVTEYDVTLPNGTSSIKVTGDKESSVSNVTGLGEVSVSEGVNTINIEVAAENGAKRTYVIRATVEEEEPIIVDVDGSDYTLIRKSEFMPSVSDYYVLSTITINEKEVPAYTSEVTHYTLVGLKDSSGNVSLYKYDNGTYTKYNEYGFSSIKLSLLKPDSIITGYTEGSIIINEKEVEAYIKDGELPLLYGINVETGEVNYYSYDKSEGTIQKYVVSDKKDNTKYYPIIIISLAGLSLLEFIIIICVIASKNKKKDIDKIKKEEIKKEEITDEDVEKKLGHTALISSSVGNVFDGSPNKEKKSKKKNNDDDMYNF